MDTSESFKSQLYSINARSFDDIALQLFRFQAQANIIYGDFIRNLGVDPGQVASVYEIPFMPVSFFKHHEIKTGAWTSSTIYTSSGTTGESTARHHIRDVDFYLNNAMKCFDYFFGDPTRYHFLALLPSYLERKNSSLVAMMDHFIKASKSEYSGFYLNNIDALVADLAKLKSEKKTTILWGVSFALIDLAEKYKPDLSHCMIFETGGMKGRRAEITRSELHEMLCKGLNVSKIYSEYGMTELLSQAYSKGGDTFYCPPWMKVIGRDVTDPLRKGLLGETSGINVVDLANWHSGAFLEIEDMGQINSDGSFEVKGRLDNTDIRGCNLMVE